MNHFERFQDGIKGKRLVYLLKAFYENKIGPHKWWFVGTGALVLLGIGVIAIAILQGNKTAVLPEVKETESVELVAEPIPLASATAKPSAVIRSSSNPTSNLASFAPSPTPSPDPTLQPVSTSPLALNTTSVSVTLDKAGINEWGSVFGSGFTVTANEDIQWTQLSSTNSLFYPFSGSHISKGSSFEYRVRADEGTPLGNSSGEVKLKYKTTSGSTGEVGPITYNFTVVDSRSSGATSPSPTSTP